VVSNFKNPGEHFQAGRVSPVGLERGQSFRLFFPLPKACALRFKLIEPPGSFEFGSATCLSSGFNVVDIIFSFHVLLNFKSFRNVIQKVNPGSPLGGSANHQSEYPDDCGCPGVFAF